MKSNSFAGFIILVILSINFYTILSDAVVIYKTNNNNSPECFSYPWTGYENAENQHNNIQAQYSQECSLCVYVCYVGFLTSNVTFSISVQKTAGLHIICDRQTAAVSELGICSLEKFVNLIDLRFYNCRFEENVTIGDWVGQTNLRYLSVQSSAAAVPLHQPIAKRSFENRFYQNSQIDTIDLSKNQLTALPTDLMCQWTFLLRLVLRDNQISDLSFLYQPCHYNDSTALPLQYLEHLDASGNNVIEVSHKMFTSFPHLRFLSLRKNGIHTISISGWDFKDSTVSSVWTLDLSDNSIKAFRACEVLANAVFLNISSNPLQCTAEALQFQACKHLVYLTIQNIDAGDCNFMWTAVSRAPTIRQLSLAGSHLMSLDFRQIPKILVLLNANSSHIHTLSDRDNTTEASSDFALETINLEKNELKELVGITFPSKVLHINLAHNAIEYIEARVFSRCLSVTRILLNDNRLTDITALFGHLGTLIELQLQKNNIAHFDYSMIHSFLSMIDISENAISELTDKEQRHYSENQVNLQFLFVAKNHFITLTQESFAPSLYNVDISNSVIDSAHTDAFKNLNLAYFLVLDNVTIHNSQSPYLKVNKTEARHDFCKSSNCGDADLSCSCSCYRDTHKNTTEKSYCNSHGTQSTFINYDFSFNLDVSRLTYCIVEVSCFDLCARAQFYGNNENYQPLNVLFCTFNGDFSSFTSDRVNQMRNQNFQKRRGLMLNNMSIFKLNDGAFEDFQELVILNLDNNFIDKLLGEEFRGLRRLTKLFLNKNNITSVREYSFRDLESLTMLQLKQNRLRHIKRDAFAFLRNLRKLYLDGNQLTALLDYNFAELAALRTLYLSSNKLLNLEKTSFAGLWKLSKLDLAGNRINHIDDLTFANLTKLKSLWLERNNITSIGKLTFYGLKYLQTLRLHSNKIRYIEGNSFKEVISLQQLSLHDNQLQRWSLTMPSNDMNITIANNHFPCDCKSVFLLQEELNKISEMISDSDKNRCIVSNSNFPKIYIQNMTEKDCYNATSPDNHPELLLAVSLGPAAFLLAVLSVIVALYVHRLEVQVLLYSKFNIRLWAERADGDLEKEYDAFIAYNCDDREFIAEKLLPGLEERFRVCIHERDFPAGAYIMDTIADVVEKSCRTLVILTPSFVQSEWCLLEFKYAHYQALKDRCCRLIIIVVEDVDNHQVSSELRAYMRTNTFLKWGDPLFWHKLLYAMPDQNKQLHPSHTPGKESSVF